MRTLAQSVVDAIKDRILDGSLPPGAKLPAEGALAREQKVSRTVVRDAVARLQTEGLIETFHGKGSYVLSLPESGEFRFDGTEIRKAADVLAVMDFRIGVESEAAAISATKITSAGRKEIRQAMWDYSGAADGDVVQADFAFHRAVARTTGNGFYIDVLESLGPLMIMLPRTQLGDAFSRTDAGHVERVEREHENIAEAILAEDPESARAAMRLHLGNTRRRLTPEEA